MPSDSSTPHGSVGIGASGVIEVVVGTSVLLSENDEL